MADPNCTYAVVDMSKKKKKRTPAKKESLELESAYYSTPSEYSMVTYDADSQELPAKPITAADEDYRKPEKSAAAKSSIQEPVITTSAARVRDKIARLTQIMSDKKSRKPAFCAIAIIVTSIVLAIIIFSCIAALFAEIGKLEVKMKAQQMSSNDRHQNETLLAQQASNLSLLIAEQDRLKQELRNNLTQISTTVFEGVTQQLMDQQISLNATLAALQSSLENTLSLLHENLTESEQDFVRLERNTQAILNMAWEILNQNLTELKIELETVKSELQTLRDIFQGQSETIPASSCAALPPSSPSGYYWVTASNGSAVRVYCDMTRSCGGVTGGWMRVAELDMTNSSHQCPSGLMERNVSAGQTEPRTCVSTNTTPSCSDGTFFDTIITNYTKVCGKIIGYQISGVNGFQRVSEQVGIDSYYVDGVSLTHGSPRLHIWTFVAARQLGDDSQCPAEGTPPPNYAREPPNFVGTDYFCDTGEINTTGLAFYADHPLWDCPDESTNCDSSSPPWFYKQLPQPTTDNIEMRVCRDEDITHEDVAIEMIELYVQ